MKKTMLSRSMICLLLAALMTIGACAMSVCALAEAEGSCENGHTIKIDKAVPATCTEPGLTEGQWCTVCYTVIVEQKDVPAGHKVAEGSNVCSVCGVAVGDADNNNDADENTDVDVDINENTGDDDNTAKDNSTTTSGCAHEIVFDEAVAPTCITTGLTLGSHCRICGMVVQAQEIVPKAEHIPETVAAVPPTCSNIGYTEGTRCRVCKTVLDAQKIVPPLDHTPVADKAVQATCTAAGLSEGFHCAVCGETLVVQEVVPAKGHTIVVVPGFKATCKSVGLTDKEYCSVCGEIISPAVILPVTDHTIATDPGLKPTCTEAGITPSSYCSVCNATLTAPEFIPALGHDDGEWIEVTKASCGKEGYSEKRCTACGFVLDTATNPALKHVVVTEKAVEATCAETGLTEGSYCSVCEEVFAKQEVIPALGHTVVTEEAVEATCTEAGLTEGSYCSVCDEVFAKQEVIPALGHTVVTDEAVEATCTKAGLTEGSHCSVCDEVFVKQEVIPAGHKAEAIPEVKATCLEAGLTEGSKCSVCGEVLVEQEAVPALGHNWKDGKAATCTEQGVRLCTNCGETERTPVLGHDEGTWVVVTEATTTTEGFKERRCTVCQFVLESAVIEKLEDEDTRVPGDVNGDGIVDGRDLLRLARYIGGHPVDITEENATVNGDSIIDGRDLLRLARYVGGHPVDLK